MADYIRDQIKLGGLTSWTVCLKNTGRTEPMLKIGEYSIGQGLKRSKGQYLCDSSVCSIKSLKSKDEEYLDFTQNQIEEKDKMKKMVTAMIRCESSLEQEIEDCLFFVLLIQRASTV